MKKKEYAVYYSILIVILIIGICFLVSVEKDMESNFDESVNNFCMNRGFDKGDYKESGFLECYGDGNKDIYRWTDSMESNYNLAMNVFFIANLFAIILAATIVFFGIELVFQSSN